MSKIHDLKIAPQYFKAVRNYSKLFELRKNDRDYEVGDVLRLLEWDGEAYTGRAVTATASYILPGGEHGLDKDYCIIGLDNIIDCACVGSSIAKKCSGLPFGKFCRICGLAIRNEG